MRKFTNTEKVNGEMALEASPIKAEKMYSFNRSVDDRRNMKRTERSSTRCADAWEIRTG